jgi:hypothetical protein
MTVQQPCDFPQDFVSRQMTEFIVELFEVVDVEQHQGARARRLFDVAFLKQLIEPPTIADPGQLIGRRLRLGGLNLRGLILNPSLRLQQLILQRLIRFQQAGDRTGDRPRVERRLMLPQVRVYLLHAGLVLIDILGNPYREGTKPLGDQLDLFGGSILIRFIPGRFGRSVRPRPPRAARQKPSSDQSDGRGNEGKQEIQHGNVVEGGAG